MNADFGPSLGISSPPLMSGGSSVSKRFDLFPSEAGTFGSNSSRGSSHSVSPRPHLSPRRPHQTNSVPLGARANGKANRWIIPLCYEPENDENTCCLGLFCPQILYGRTQFRLRQITRNRDPTDLSAFEKVNGPCETFMLVGLAQFSWLFIFMQHSRIRDMYSIDGTTTNDCLSAYACPCCTLMQDDREIRARQYEDKKNEKDDGPINRQPSTQLEMKYISPRYSAEETIQHRGSLVREPHTPAAAMSNQNGTEHIKQQAEPKKLQKIPKVDANKGQGKVNSEVADTYLNQGEPVNVNSLPKLSKHPTTRAMTRDAIIASRQTWRKQSFSSMPDVQSHSLVESHSGGSTKAHKNQDPFISRHRSLHYSENASLSQIGGKRVLKQLSEASSNSLRLKSSNESESHEDETVLVFYEEGEDPLRHSLADCARLRASTLDHIDSSNHNELFTRWRSNKPAPDCGPLNSSGKHNLAGCPVVVVTEDLTPLDQLHILKDYYVEDNNINIETEQKHQSEPRSVDICIAKAGHMETGTSESRCDGPSVAEQHVNDECPPNIIAKVADQKAADEIPQHTIAECAERFAEAMHVESVPQDQHSILNVSVNCDAQTMQMSCVNQHTLPLGVTVSDDTQSGGSEDQCSFDNRLGPESAADESVGRSVTANVPQNPVIIVTTSLEFEDATRGHHDQGRGSGPEIFDHVNGSKVSESHHGESSNPTGDNDGSVDVNNRQQFGQAAAALRKLLQAAADIHLSKTPKRDNPTEEKVHNTLQKSALGSRDMISRGSN